jgi:hypothetical protein
MARFSITSLPLVSRFTAVGALQGLALWWLMGDLGRSGLHSLPELQLGLLYAVLAGPLALFCTQDVQGLPGRVRLVAVLLYVLVFAGMGGYAAWTLDRTSHGNLLASAVLGFVSLGLLCGFDFAQRRWDYAKLFHYTWRNGILAVTAAIKTAAMWIVLTLGASLMELVQVHWVRDAIGQPLFMYVATGSVAALAFTLGLERAAMTETIRRFWLTLSSWLLPLVLLFAVLWLVTITTTGLNTLFESHSAALLLLWFSALAVKFANCAYQDGSINQPYPRWVGRFTQTAWLAMLPLIAIAIYALWLRIAQYGLTESRIWAILVAVLVLVYGVGYALSWLHPARWMSAIARTNIAAALVLCLGLLALLSPLAPVQRLAVWSHLQHVQAQQSSGLEPDWNYLRWQTGRFGRDALENLAKSPATQGVPATWAAGAQKALDETERYSERAPLKTLVTTEEIASKIKTYPQGRTLPASFLQHVHQNQTDWRFSRCLGKLSVCHAWVGHLQDAGTENVALSVLHERSFQVFSETPNGWKHIGNIDVPHATTPADLQNIQTAPSPWKDWIINGERHTLRLGSY